MRIPLIMTGTLAALLAVSPLQRALAQDDNGGSAPVSFDLFYNNLSDDGDWYNTPEYGYVWQPFIAYKTDSWRPYSDGYWAQTDSGWTWVSYENFGWATYHYGRWTRLKDTGWVWVPGYQWGPGWVSWRTSDDYVGWAPLPPKVERGVYDGKIVNRQETSIDYNDVEPEDDGYTANVDADYDIGPANYCFVGTRSFGAPVLSEVLLPPQQNVTIIERTTNVTNIYYNHESSNVFVYNGGPNYNFISAHSERPIQQLQIERVQNTSYIEQGLRAGGNPTQVRGGILQVAAPLIAPRPVNFQQIKPAHIKETLTQPQVVHGWTNTGANPEVVQQLHNRFKEQAQQAPAKAVAPRERVVQPLPPEQRIVTKATLPTAPAANTGGPEAAAAAAKRAQRQQERAAQAGQPAAQPGQPAQAGQPKTGAPGQPLTEEERVAKRNAAQQARTNRDQSRTNGQPNPAAAGQPATNQPKTGQPAAAQTGQPAAQPGQPQDNSPEAKAARKAQRQQERAAQTNGGQPAQAAAKAPEQAVPQGSSDEARAARKAQRAQERAAQGNQGQPAQPEAKTPEQGQSQATSDEARAARKAQRAQERAAQQPQAQPEQAAPQADAEREARKAQRQPEHAEQQPAAQPAPAQADQEREARKAQRQQEQAQPAQAKPEREERQPQQRPQPQQQPNQTQRTPEEREAHQAQKQQEQAQRPQPPKQGDKDKDKPNQ